MPSVIRPLGSKGWAQSQCRMEPIWSRKLIYSLSCKDRTACFIRAEEATWTPINFTLLEVDWMEEHWRIIWEVCLIIINPKWEWEEMLGTICITLVFLLNNHHNSLSFLRLITQTLICNKANRIKCKSLSTKSKQKEYWISICKNSQRLLLSMYRTTLSSRVCSKITESSTLNLYMNRSYPSFILPNSQEGIIAQMSLKITTILWAALLSLWFNLFRIGITYLHQPCLIRFFNSSLRE